MANSAVAATALRIARTGRDVLRDVSFTVPACSVNGLLGPSGCGKTTLLRAIMGVQAVTAGVVEVLGHPAGHPGLRRRIGYATQTPAVYADLTVAECLRYFAAVLGAPATDVDRVLADVDLAGQRDRLVGSLSGGQRGRASLAVALLGEPELLVLDEPTVGLDPVLREDLWSLFHRLAAAGTTLIVSSHVMDEAARCDRLLILRDGTVFADDTPDGLRAATGETDLERAFLQLVRERETV
ncbi:ABC transporter ATP-binding protein [Actinokineospora enzanensis]|uniref:ABC transporter ATP-binding protein n=1 Tax=Actinokineospora enzanensis TaxID=155975 RepID=UPI000477004A|nr:ABC transporter ATP-binding protein [Actinokineospora enzanensis]